MQASEEHQGMLLGFMGVVAFGLTLPFTKVAVPYMDPLFIGFGRAALAGCIAALLLWRQRAEWPSRQQWKGLLIVSLGVVIGFPLASSMAMESVDASHGAVVLGLLPLATAVAAVGLARERPSLGFWVMAVLGSVTLIYFITGGATTEWMSGDLALLLAIFCASIGYAVGGMLSRDMGGWQVICWALVLVLPITFVSALWYMPPIVSVPLSAWGGFLYLALVSQLLGFFLWNKGLALGGVARVSQVQLFQIFITLMASQWLLGEMISFRTLFFALIIFIIVALGKAMPIRRY